MSREYGLFVIKHSIFSKLPIELIQIITNHFYNNLIEYIVLVYKLNWRWEELLGYLSQKYIADTGKKDLAEILIMEGCIIEPVLIEGIPDAEWN